jgi:hypothetical protein
MNNAIALLSSNADEHWLSLFQNPPKQFNIRTHLSKFLTISMLDHSYNNNKMPLGLMYQRDSYYNYGTISPNNIIMHVNTYTTGSYTGAGTVWRDLSGYGNNMSLISTLFTGSIGLNGGISFNGSGSYGISSNDLIASFSCNRRS